MVFNDLVNKLKNMYKDQGKNKAAMVHLFGIKYHKEIEGIKQQGHPLKDLAEKATGHSSYATEIAKGMKLALYVRPID